MRIHCLTSNSVSLKKKMVMVESWQHQTLLPDNWLLELARALKYICVCVNVKVVKVNKVLMWIMGWLGT